jgi:trk system potassium uptake protein TrkH
MPATLPAKTSEVMRGLCRLARVIAPTLTGAASPLRCRRGGTELAAFEAIGASAACLGNVGAAFGFAGPFGSYEPFSDLSTGVLGLLMWLGRVEIGPVAVLLGRSYWRA